MPCLKEETPGPVLWCKKVTKSSFVLTEEHKCQPKAELPAICSLKKNSKMDSPASEATKACFRKKAYILSGDSCTVLLISTKKKILLKIWAHSFYNRHIPHKPIYKYKSDHSCLSMKKTDKPLRLMLKKQKKKKNLFQHCMPLTQKHRERQGGGEPEPVCRQRSVCSQPRQALPSPFPVPLVLPAGQHAEGQPPSQALGKTGCTSPRPERYREICSTEPTPPTGTLTKDTNLGGRKHCQPYLSVLKVYTPLPHTYR